MKSVTVTQGYVASVSDRDYARVFAAGPWRVRIDRRKDGRVRNVYAIRNVRKDDGTQTTQYMHRFILGATDHDVQVDHSPDHSGLNCTRENLRRATQLENNRNQRIRMDNTSGVKGVSWSKARQKWRAHICVNGKRKYLGYFTRIEDAREAYDSAALKYHGKFALTNTMLQAA
jgi:hypothetical protein